MADWQQAFSEASWAVDRALGGQNHLTRSQKWVARHPLRFGLFVGAPVALVGLATAGLGAADVIFSVLSGFAMGGVFGLSAVGERLRQRRLRRLGIWNGA